MKKKSQIQMFETIAVLVVFFFLIAFGLSFYFVIAKSSAQKEHERTIQLNAVNLIQKASTLPELDCILVGVQVENCFDILKAKHFARLLENENVKDAYFDVFGFTEVTLTTVFPSETEPLPLYKHTLGPGTFDLTTVPILLFDPVNDTFAFGIMEVKVFER